MVYLIRNKAARLILRQWRRYSADWHVFLEQPIDAQELSRTCNQTSVPSFGFYFMLSLAAIIATLGLLSNSAATIIGAMIVAPLMGPIVSAAFGIVVADYKLLKRSAITIVLGIALTVGVAAISAQAIGMRVVGNEILARTNPTLLDLGVAVAAGAAGAFAMTRRSVANAIAGVAIAVALVPPLCVLGIGIALGSDVALGMGLSMGDRGIIPGSFLLFATNLIGIVVSAGLVFLFHNYGRIQRAIGGLLLAVLSMLAVSAPLGFSFNRLLLRSDIYHSLSEVQRQRPDLFEDVSGYAWNVRFYENAAYVEMDLMAPTDSVNDDHLALIGEAIAQEVKTPVKLKFRLIPVEIVGMNMSASGQPQSPTSTTDIPLKAKR